MEVAQGGAGGVKRASVARIEQFFHHEIGGGHIQRHARGYLRVELSAYGMRAQMVCPPPAGWLE